MLSNSKYAKSYRILKKHDQKIFYVKICPELRFRLISVTTLRPKVSSEDPRLARNIA